MKNQISIQPCADCLISCIMKISISEELASRMQENKRTILYQKGETLFKQNAFVSHFAVIKKGIVKTVIEGSNTKNLIADFSVAGEYLGLQALFGQNYHPFTSIALSEVEACLIEKNYFKEIIEEQPKIHSTILATFSEKFDFLYTKLGIVGTKQLHGRLAETIIYLSGDKFKDVRIFQSITRKDMAEFSGMSLESMIRLLNELKNDKIVTLKGKEIIINDIELLLTLSKAG